MNKLKRQTLLSNGVSYIILILFSVLVLFPILWMASTAFKDSLEVLDVPSKWIPRRISFESFGRLWKEYPFSTYFKNSTIISLISVVISVFFSCLAGYGATRFRFKGRGMLLTFILITQMFPSVMLLVPYYSVIKTLHLTNTYLGIILVYTSFTTPFCTWMMLGFFKALPLEMDEAARIDGCGVFKTFWKIILPLTLPGIASTSIYAFITSWNEYMFAFTLNNSEAMKTLSVGIAELNGYQQVVWNDMMAASILASIPLIILFAFLQNYFINGLTAGAVKT